MAFNISHADLPVELFICLGEYTALRAKLSGRGAKGPSRSQDVGAALANLTAHALM